MVSVCSSWTGGSFTSYPKHIFQVFSSRHLGLEFKTLLSIKNHNRGWSVYAIARLEGVSQVTLVYVGPATLRSLQKNCTLKEL